MVEYGLCNPYELGFDWIWYDVTLAYSAGHAAEESYPVFNERYTQFFEGVEDLFEVCEIFIDLLSKGSS